MEIRRGTFLYRVAYGYLPKYQQPSKVNLCQFVRRLVWTITVGWPSLIVLATLVFSVITIGRFITIVFIVLLFGYKPVSAPWKKIEEPFLCDLQPIQRWPKWRGQHVFPIILIAAAGIGWILFQIGILFYRYPRTTGLTLLVLVLLIAVSLAIMRAKNSQTWQVALEYVKAKKAKICPYITFTD